MAKCIDPETGVLLHAYEMYALTDLDQEKFEKHLLECEYCFHELKQFQETAETMRTAESTRRLIERSEPAPDRNDSFLKRLWRNLWPDIPLVLRPGLLVLALAILVYPAYLGMYGGLTDRVTQVQFIMLTPTRSAGEVATAGQDISLAVYYSGAQPDSTYLVEIVHESGEVIYRDDAFHEFDRYEYGHFLIPHRLLQSGRYRVVIARDEGAPPDRRQEYEFRIQLN